MFTSLNNFRPIGGKLFAECKVADEANTLGLSVYRSSRLDKISEEDLISLKNDLGIKTVIDFRDFLGEYKKHDGEKLLDLIGVEVMDVNKTIKAKNPVWLKSHHPLSTNQVRHCMIDLLGKVFVINLFLTDILSIWKRIIGVFLSIFYILFKLPWIVYFIKHEVELHDLLTMYIALIDCSGAQINLALKQMLQPGNLPCVICCHVGKDRTGIMSALLLSICGYSVEKIADDYHKTEIGLPSNHKEFQIYSPHVRKAPRQVIFDLFDYIENKYGSVSKYLQVNGFTVEEQHELKTLLTFKK